MGETATKRDQFLLLKRLYSETRSRTRALPNLWNIEDFETSKQNGHVLNKWELGKKLDLDDAKTASCLDALHGSGLVEQRFDEVRLSMEGVREIEAALLDPSTPSEFFPSMDELGISDPEAFRSTVPAKMAPFSLRQFQMIAKWTRIAGTLEIADEDLLSELQAEVKTINAQLTSSRPKRDVVVGALLAVGRIAKHATPTPTKEWVLSELETLKHQLL